MKNLEQVRAAHALHQARNLNLKQKDVAKLPPLILNNGLLATAAFALDEKRGPMLNAMNALADHLAERKLVGQVTIEGGTTRAPNTEEMLGDLAERPEALPLQRATAEALAYLSYLKRFASSEKEEGT